MLIFSFSTAFASALLSASAMASDEALSEDKNLFVPYKLRGVQSSTNVDDEGVTPSVPLILEATEVGTQQAKDVLEKNGPHGKPLRNVIPDSNASNKILFDPSAELGILESSLVANHALAGRTGEEFAIFLDVEGYPYYGVWDGGYLYYYYHDTSMWTASELEQYKESAEMDGHHSSEEVEVRRELRNELEFSTNNVISHRASSARKLGKEGVNPNGCAGNFPVINVSGLSFRNLIKDCRPPANGNCPPAYVGNLGCWDVSKVTNMDQSFFQLSDFNEDISFWNTSQVTSMLSTFLNAFAFNQDVSYWDVSSVITFEDIFFGASVFNQPVGRWDISSAYSIRGAFAQSGFNQRIDGWDVSRVTDMGYLANDSNFNQCLSTWAYKVRNFVFLKDIFKESSCTVLQDPTPGVSPWCQKVSDGCPAMTENPTESPTENPTDSPTENPTESPTENPTESPTENPTESPTENPTDSPIENPTESPTKNPLCKNNAGQFLLSAELACSQVAATGRKLRNDLCNNLQGNIKNNCPQACRDSLAGGNDADLFTFTSETSCTGILNSVSEKTIAILCRELFGLAENCPQVCPATETCPCVDSIVPFRFRQTSTSCAQVDGSPMDEKGKQCKKGKIKKKCPGVCAVPGCD